MLTDKHIDPPDDCKACEEYHVFRDGLCWKCWTEAQEIRVSGFSGGRIVVQSSK